MKYLLFICLFILIAVLSKAQTIEELYAKRDYKELVKNEGNTERLTGRELYDVGYAFFQLENDDKAVLFYNMAIAKGLDSPYVHFYKALSLRYAKKLDASLAEFDVAIKGAPENQEYRSEKAFAYYYDKQYDKALAIFEEAIKLPNTFSAPYYLVPHIYHIKNEYDKALKGYYEALNNISTNDKYYIDALEDIGQLEFTYTNDYAKSAKAYLRALALRPKEYEIYSKTMKSLNANKEYSRADSIFDVMKMDYEADLIPKEIVEFKNIPIAEYKWNGQIVMIKRYFEVPTEMLGLSYKIYLLDKAGENVQRTFLVEKTIRIEKDGPNYLLCESDKKKGMHYTYPYGFVEDNIPLENLKKALGQVLDGKVKPGASSNTER